ncbi:MAG: CDP-diacylglycerol--glycerol-3-phosphate 3-phosphatidyltransferase [Pseudomonadota bacterium]
MWTLPNILTVFRLVAALGLGLGYAMLPRPFADMLGFVLFVAAAATDWVDGYLARAWNQTSAIGAMLDPIADKAMVLVTLMVLTALFGLDPLILIPATVIVFREVFVSGMREFLGQALSGLKVSRLAKWKTTVQMIAIAVLLAFGIFQHRFGMGSFGMDAALVADILAGREEDVFGLRLDYQAAIWTRWSGVALLWLAAMLTLISGIDYWLKAQKALEAKS